LARLRALRSDLIDPTIAVHHGRVVKRTGYGALVEFRSVVYARFDPWTKPLAR
jgi:adenylate cyclase